MQTQGDARSSLALGWLVNGPLALALGWLIDGPLARCEEDERGVGKDKLEGIVRVVATIEAARNPASPALRFADVRWMEISSVLKRESANGTKPVKQIEFKGDRLDLSSVRRWRERVLGTAAI